MEGGRKGGREGGEKRMRMKGEGEEKREEGREVKRGRGVYEGKIEGRTVLENTQCTEFLHSLPLPSHSQTPFSSPAWPEPQTPPPCRVYLDPRTYHTVIVIHSVHTDSQSYIVCTLTVSHT